MRDFGSPNAVVRLDAGQEEDYQNKGKQNIKNSNNDVYLRRENQNQNRPATKLQLRQKHFN